MLGGDIYARRCFPAANQGLVLRVLAMEKPSPARCGPTREVRLPQRVASGHPFRSPSRSQMTAANWRAYCLHRPVPITAALTLLGSAGQPTATGRHEPVAASRSGQPSMHTVSAAAERQILGVKLSFEASGHQWLVFEFAAIQDLERERLRSAFM